MYDVIIQNVNNSQNIVFSNILFFSDIKLRKQIIFKFELFKIISADTYKLITIIIIQPSLKAYQYNIIIYEICHIKLRGRAAFWFSCNIKNITNKPLTRNDTHKSGMILYVFVLT